MCDLEATDTARRVNSELCLPSTRWIYKVNLFLDSMLGHKLLHFASTAIMAVKLEALSLKLQRSLSF